MDAGLLRSRVTIEQPVLGSSSTSGQRTKTFSTLFSCYANITAPSGALLDYAKSFSSVIDHVVTIRYSTSYSIPKGCRVNYGGRYFTINASVDRTNTREWLTIMCSEVTT